MEIDQIMETIVHNAAWVVHRDQVYTNEHFEPVFVGQCGQNTAVYELIQLTWYGLDNSSQRMDSAGQYLFKWPFHQTE